MNEKTLQATRLWTLAMPGVSAFITSIIRNFEDRNDILQDTAVAVVESFEKYDPAYNFTAWAIGIARNKIRNHFRSKPFLQTGFEEDVIDAIAAAFEKTSEPNPRLGFLNECLERLDARARELCDLRYKSDIKPAEIGQKLGMTANSISKSLLRIRERLREGINLKARQAGVTP